MKAHIRAINLFAFALLLPLAACSQSEPAGDSTAASSSAAAPQSFVASKVHEGLEKARRELATKDIDINSVRIGHGDEHDHSRDTLPKAAITPQGDLLIAGKKVDATPAQHALLMDYRQQLVGIAEAGMDIGERGADLGMGAAKQAIFGALTGKGDKEIEANIKPQTDAIQAAALALCKRLPQLRATQQKLAADLPAFKPYASMTQEDVEDCGKDTDKNGKKGFAAFSD